MLRLRSFKFHQSPCSSHGLITKGLIYGNYSELLPVSHSPPGNDEQYSFKPSVQQETDFYIGHRKTKLLHISPNKLQVGQSIRARIHALLLYSSSRSEA